MKRRDVLKMMGAAGSTALSPAWARAQTTKPSGAKKTPGQRPNILFVITDDQSWANTGINGDPAIKTPVFDRIAREGVNFLNSYCSSPSCTPSRAAILTGQDFCRLEEGGNLLSTLPAHFAVYPDLLEAAGYAVGYARKGWDPSYFPAGGRTPNPAGPKFTDFAEFRASVKAEQPFCFWFGPLDPHPPFKPDHRDQFPVDPQNAPKAAAQTATPTAP